MEANTERIVDKLFSKDLDQSSVRKISKDVENLQTSQQQCLVDNITARIRALIVDNPTRALTSATLLTDGNEILKSTLVPCILEVMELCIVKLESFLMTDSIKQSHFHIVAKALYSILQYIIPLEATTNKNAPILKKILSSLLKALLSNKLPSDCNLIVSTSLCIVLGQLYEERIKEVFFKLLSCLVMLPSQDFKGNFDVDESNVKTESLQTFIKAIKPSQLTVMLLHGLLNSKVPWRNSLQTQTDKNNEMLPEENVFLFDLHFLIMKCCKTAGSYTLQAFQVLQMWLVCVRQYGKIVKDSHSEIDHPASWPVLAVQDNDCDTVFHFLNSNWENPAKGVSDVVYTCMKELLELHNESKCGRAEELALDMLDGLVTSALWTSKSTYPPLTLVINYIGAQKALELHPAIPSELIKSLEVNHLASAGANVYKTLLSQMYLGPWRQHFLEITCDAMHSNNRMVRQNVLTLWLPPTIHQYPDVYPELIGKCQNSTSGWLARIAVLKLARRLGFLAMPEEDDSSYVDANHQLGSVTNYIEYSLCHIDETVRGEALAFLCCTQKGSQPVSGEEARLLKEFFKWNMNIDSAPFRQIIIKCYRVLVVRLRDSCASELKIFGYKCNTDDFEKHKNMLQESSVLQTNSEFLMWFMHFLHYNLAADGNYQRRILALQLYKETLLAFYDVSKSGCYSMSSRCANVCGFINSIELNLDSNVRVVDFTLPKTKEMLLSLCMDEMNDVREEAELTLKIIECSRNSMTYAEIEDWLKCGLTLCDSPKASYAESGATIVKVVAFAAHAGAHDISSLLKMKEHCSLLTFLYKRAKEQHETAKLNLLRAAQTAPIHGSLTALGLCLCDEASVTTMSEKDKRAFMIQLTQLLVDIVETMLSKLAYSSPNGSAVAPSFAEMGESIDQIIKECERLEEPLCTRENSCQIDNDEKLIGDEEEMYENNAISSDHQLVLACCWQTMKACCTVASKAITYWSASMEETEIESILEGVVGRLLTGTRHKGAIDAARTCYGQLCTVLLTNKHAGLGHLVYKQVNQVLDYIESGAQTSVTRRAAGIAMMMQAACGAAPRSNAELIDTTVLRLICISQAELNEQSTVDSSPVLALHILQSLVLHAPLAHHLLHHMQSITTTCLRAFTSSSWALRNAALQLYGAVVPRMVGTKKVRDDSSILNSLTAPEFIARYPDLSETLLKMLEVKVYWEKDNLSENDGKRMEANLTTLQNDKKHCSAERQSDTREDIINVKASSNLVPVLSLLSRLSPGTNLQQTSKVTNTLLNFRLRTATLLESPIHTVRRLASLGIIALTSLEDVNDVLVSHLEAMQSNSIISSNKIHGNLLTILNFLEIHSSVCNNAFIKTNVTKAIRKFTSPEYKCHINAALALRISLYINIDLELTVPTIVNALPGAAEYSHLFREIQIKKTDVKEIEHYLSSSLVEGELEESSIEHIQSQISQHTNSLWLSKVELFLWQRLENGVKNWHPTLHVLVAILKEQGKVNNIPNEGALQTVLKLLKGHYGIKASAETLVIAAFTLVSVNDLDWPGTTIREELLNTFISLISKYAAPTSTEDYRMAASYALKVVVQMPLFYQLVLPHYEYVVLACINLLQDEDSDIRDSASHIVKSLCESSDRTYNKSPGNTNVPMFHPNLALREFIQVLISWSIEDNWSKINIFWKICSNQHTGTITKNADENNLQSRCYLFQSHTMNLYKEAKHHSSIISEALINNLKDKQMTDHEKSEWLQDECEKLNSMGAILNKELSCCPMLIFNKTLLEAVGTYIIAWQTLDTLGKIINSEVHITYKLSWNENRYCSVISCSK